MQRDRPWPSWLCCWCLRGAGGYGRGRGARVEDGLHAQCLAEARSETAQHRAAEWSRSRLARAWGLHPSTVEAIEQSAYRKMRTAGARAGIRVEIRIIDGREVISLVDELSSPRPSREEKRKLAPRWPRPPAEMVSRPAGRGAGSTPSASSGAVGPGSSSRAGLDGRGGTPSGDRPPTDPGGALGPSARGRGRR